MNIDEALPRNVLYQIYFETFIYRYLQKREESSKI